MRSTLRSARLRRILAAYAVNRIGTFIGLLALLVAVFDHTHSALAVAGLLLAGQAVPAFAVPSLVARVEASSRGHELSGLYVFEAVVTAGLAGLLMWHFQLAALLVLAALDGTAALAASALLRAELARAARDQLAAQPATQALDEAARATAAQQAERSANAALNVTFSATFVAGPVLGGVIVAAAGAPAALLIDVASFLACGVLLLDLHPHVDEAGGDSVLGRLRTAWLHISQTRALRTLLLVDAIALVCFESAAPVEVTFAKATLHAGDRGLGLLLTAWGAGAVIGSLVFARLRGRSLALMLSAGALAIGFAYIGLAAAPTLAVACLMALLGGIGNGVELPALMSVVQELTPHSLHGRIIGAVESLGALCVAIGLPLGGALVALSSPRIAFVVIGAGTTAVAVALFAVSRGWAHPGQEQEHGGAPVAETAITPPPA